jgi:hypothetical protein
VEGVVGLGRNKQLEKCSYGEIFLFYRIFGIIKLACIIDPLSPVPFPLFSTPSTLPLSPSASPSPFHLTRLTFPSHPPLLSPSEHYITFPPSLAPYLLPLPSPPPSPPSIPPFPPPSPLSSPHCPPLPLHLAM